MTTDQKPRVSAAYSIDAITMRRHCQQFGYTSPDVHVEVGFDLHDHQAALSALESAVANVRAQIEETK